MSRIAVVSLFALVALLAGVPAAAHAAVDPDPVVTVSISVPDPAKPLAAGETRQFSATAHRKSGATEDVTLTASWLSSATSVLSVDSSGVALGNLPGTSKVTATFAGRVSPGIRLTVSRCNIIGTEGADTLNGTTGADIICGLGGDDVITGDDGADDIDGGAGIDTITGGLGADKLRGGADRDDIDGGDANDVIYGDAGDDTLQGAVGNDTVYGGLGGDTVNGGDGVDQLRGDAGNDTLDGQAGDDRAWGGTEDDTVNGGSEHDQLFGEAGNDSLDGGTGDDRLSPGAGDDTLIDGGDGVDTVLYDTATSSVTVSLNAGDASGDSIGYDVLSQIENATGSAYEDALIGDGGPNLLNGGASRDVLNALGDADRIYGGTGPDTVYGGAGNDYVLGQDDGDEIYGEEGNDSVDAGTGNDTVDGGDDNDSLTGDAGADILYGGNGDDSLNPGLGDDATVDGGPGTDAVAYSNTHPAVTVDLATGMSTSTGGNDVLGGIEDIGGTNGDDFLYGDEGPNRISGKAGNDTIDGRGGDDRLFGGDGDDGIRGGEGTDFIDGQTGTDTADQPGSELTYNLPPVLTIGDNANSFTEGDAAKAVDSTLTLTDDSAVLKTATITIGEGFESGKDLLSVNGALPAGVTATYVAPTLTITGDATPAQYETMLQNVRFENTSQDPSTAQRTISFTVSDDEHTDSTGNDVAMDVLRVNDPPLATADTYGGGQRGVRMRVGSTHADSHETEHTGNVLDNDLDVDTAFTSLTVTPGTYASADGGAVTLAQNGTFTYDPPAGDDGADSFTYTVEDNDTGDSDGTEDTHTATATLTRAGDLIWFVDDSAPTAGGRGTSHSPLQSLAPLSTGGTRDGNDGAHDRIFVYSGTYTNGIVLEGGQDLIGEPHGLNAGGTQFVAAGGSKPAISSAGGNVITLGTDNDVQDLALGNTPAASYSLHAPTGVGAFTVADTDIANGTGGALHVADGTPAVTLGTLSSTGSTNHGVRIADTEGGTVSSTAGTLANATAADFATSNSNTTVTLGSAISDDIGQLVNVSGGTGDVTYKGTITDLENGTGDGIAITGTSGDHDFAGQLLLSTNSTTAPALSMTNSAAAFLQVDPPAGVANRLASSGHAALRVTDTKIHTDGLEFQKIGTTGTFSDRDGVELSNTGHDTAAYGRLVVTGTGPADTGGLILGRRNGITVTNSNGPSLQDMKLSGHSDFAIRGTTVRGFNMDDTVIDGSVNNATGQAFNGTDPNTDEGAVSFDNLTGTGVTISDSTIARGIYNGLRLVNSTGTLNRLTVTNTAFNSGATQPNGNDNVLIEAAGNAILNATISGSTFTNVRGDHIDTGHGGTSSGDVQILNNTMSTTLPQSEILGGGINVDSSGSGDITYAVNGNTVTGSTATAIVAGKLFGGSPGDGTAVGTISGNTVGNAAVAGSGSNAGSAIDVSVLGNGKHTVQVTNNQLRQYGQHGILATAGGASRSVTGLAHNAAFNLHVTGNTIELPFNTNASSSGFQLIAGTNSGEPTGSVPDDYNVCLNLSGNNANNSGEDDASSARRDYVIRQRFETQVQLPGWTGPTSGDTTTMSNAMASYLTSTGRAAAGFSNFTSSESASYSQSLPPRGFFSVASCPTT